MSLPLINGGDNIENEESKFINMNLILNSKFTFAILINPPDWILLYNKAYVSILKAKHPDG
ncbi:hypothetical protein C2G38_2118381 [Gigaspora rosea]|uniref:Uncharacterized protein n=1 Tax=Gigaspora rosea TaxID=44941 RepID=A0A397U6W1_9GLOM|nr:hypothetical protein C2G38_2118381 [Gigaspora rosea]